MSEPTEPALGSVHWGDSTIHRLHIGDHRVLYEVTDVIRVWTIGRITS